MKQSLFTTLLAVCIIATSCNESTNKNQSNEAETAEHVIDTILKDRGLLDQEIYDKAVNAFHAMPSPIEFTGIIESADISFQKDVLLDPRSSSDYTTAFQKAVILGVFGAEMSYCGIHNQQQDALKFMAASKRVAGGIGIHDAFSSSVVERANANMDNKDSMLIILSEVYWNINSQLNEENRNQIELLILCSGWIETLFLSTSGLGDTPPEMVVQRIMEQRYSALEIKSLLDSYPTDPMITDIREIISPVLSSYENITFVDGESTMKEGSNGTMTIGGTMKLDYSNDDFVALKNTIVETRDKLIAI